MICYLRYISMIVTGGNYIGSKKQFQGRRWMLQGIRNAHARTLVRCAPVAERKWYISGHNMTAMRPFGTLWYRRLLTALLILIPSRGYWFLKAFQNAELPAYAVPCRRCLSEDVDIF